MRTMSVVLVGMVVVFASLALLILCIKVYSSIIIMFRNRKNNVNNNKVQKNDIQIKDVPETTSTDTIAESATEGINPEIIAVITAAIVASMGSSGAGFKVKSIKRIGHTTPVWNVAGRNEYILSKL